MNAPASTADQAQPPMAALFVSDLHLSPAMPKTADAFFRFLDQKAGQSRCVYLLGDIFEYWAGDDDIADPFNHQIVTALHALAATGVQLFWIAGNRDFLAGPAFAAATGVTLLPDPSVIELAGQRLLLLHGDEQCTDDHAYMAFRTQVRDTAWQRSFLERPLAERKKIIEGMRAGSREAQRDKAMAIMDVNPQAIDRLFVEHQVNLMIHGHTHRPAVHRSDLGTRHVLPDWDCDHSDGRGGWLSIDTSGDIQTHSMREL
jgi:UDP-2,3-diacylglucosamine hydrolase